MALTLEDLQAMAEFERRWDDRIGGEVTRPYRELLCFTLARLMSAGAELEDLLSYQRECVAEFAPLARRESMS
jgi:hypothetical protein